jgi:hypothetical protein
MGMGIMGIMGLMGLMGLVGLMGNKEMEWGNGNLFALTIGKLAGILCKQNKAKGNP